MRVRETVIPKSFLYGGPKSSVDVDVYFKYISDVNNKRARPQSPCEIIEAKANLNPIRTVGGFAPAVIRWNAKDFDSYVMGKSSDMIKSCEKQILARIKNAIDRQQAEFSSLNFLYELREIPDQIRKIKNSKTVRYIDYAFGVAPLISDLKNLVSRYNSTASRVNSRMDQFRSIPFTTMVNRSSNYDEYLSDSGVNARNAKTSIRTKCGARGNIVMSLPWLAELSPEIFAILDQIAVDPSAGNAYEAIPYSWLLDWFLPVGDYLDSLPSLMRPEARFSGSMFTKVVGQCDIESRPDNVSFLAGYDDAGSLSTKHFVRKVFNEPISKLIKWDLGGINRPEQLLLLRDIAFPVSGKKRKPNSLFPKVKKK